ncbi:sigma-70 family RNA polymerase sigma factor [Marinococcus luteus]|uniref:sigma-70 family RNA polymerase sigma factor n=1 Tax=Marinococcus luteus TaxID=1122204 RepID=UPI002ACCF3BA|nr:sigma-70 family RNA polymerase sigma factor [Marinococcus luteus]MDZ5782094.1 sigma-70 family RNA polymerase sigma factor [Marinococcus luteus]
MAAVMGEHQTMNVDEVETLICEYYWRKAEIQRLQELLYESCGSMVQFKMVATYGVEAAMPVGSKGKSMAEYQDIERREERILKQLEKYKNIAMFIELGERELKGHLHEVIYSCMMDGMSYRAIAKHLKMNKDKVRKLKDECLRQLSQNRHFRQNLHYLKYHKQII